MEGATDFCSPSINVFWDMLHYRHDHSVESFPIEFPNILRLKNIQVPGKSWFLLWHRLSCRLYDMSLAGGLRLDNKDWVFIVSDGYHFLCRTLDVPEPLLWSLSWSVGTAKWPLLFGLHWICMPCDIFVVVKWKMWDPPAWTQTTSIANPCARPTLKFSILRNYDPAIDSAQWLCN